MILDCMTSTGAVQTVVITSIGNKQLDTEVLDTFLAPSIQGMTKAMFSDSESVH